MRKISQDYAKTHLTEEIKKFLSLLYLKVKKVIEKQNNLNPTNIEIM